MSQRFTYLNGRLVPEREARVSFFDAGVLSGEMAFEATRTFRGQPFALRHHLERLYGTLDVLGIECPLPIDRMEAETHETLRRNRPTEPPDMEWQILHNVSPGPASEYAAAFPPAERRPTVAILCFPLIARLGRFAAKYASGVRLVVPQQRAIPPELIDPHAKTRSRAHLRLAQLQAERIEPGSWPVLLTPDGFLGEGPAWNIFLVQGGELLTPAAKNVLLGVSRTTTLGLAEQAGIPARECDLTIADAQAADEIFCTATSFCLVHAATFQGRRIGDGLPGPVFRRLAEGWRKVVGLDFVAQSQDYARRLPAWEAAQSSPVTP